MNMQLNLDQMKDAQATMSTAAKEIESLMASIKTQMEKIGSNGDGTWTGDVADPYRENFDTVVAKFPEFQSAVDSCHEYLTKYINDYEQMQNSILGQQQ